MCGVLGAVGIDLKNVRAEPILAGRGPDECSAFRATNSTIWHSRLATVGTTSAASRQPIRAEGLVLVCNGFISNSTELELDLGLDAESADCRLILHVYSRYGLQGLSLLRGQFAAAILDQNRQELVLARDMTGICPMYYCHPHDGTVAFASQANWLRRCGLTRSTIVRPAAREEVVELGYVVSNETLLAGVFQVPPGHAASFSLADGVLRSVCQFTRSGHEWNRDSASDHLRDLVYASTKRNLRGDWAPWLLLSGGVDSAVLLHCAVQFGVRPEVITLRYPDGSNSDEVTRAARLAQRYSCNWHLVDGCEPSYNHLLSLFPQRIDWPVDGGSLVPKAALADFISSRGGRIALGGTGADELFGGYRRHVGRMDLLQRHSKPSLTEEAEYCRKWLAREPVFDTVFRKFRHSAAESLFYDAAFIYDLLELQQCHNPRVDSCFANVGVEYRPVFQDQDIVHFAASLPLEDKSDREHRKALLRHAFHGELPQEHLLPPKNPLRYGAMGPTRQWRSQMCRAWESTFPLDSQEQRTEHA